MTVLSILVIAVLFSVSLVLAIRSRRRALLLAVFLLPWQGLDVDIGLRVTAYSVAISAILAACVVYRTLRIRETAALPASAFLLVASYAVVWSAIQIPFLPEADVQGGVLRSSSARAFFQIVMFILTISPIFLVPWATRSVVDYVSMARTYLVSVVILAVIGWLQLIVWIYKGSDPLPVGFINALLGGTGDERSGIINLYDGLIYRMSSFAGEPKGLGSVLAIALLLLQFNAVIWRSRLVLWVFLLCSLMATLSTMGIVLWVLGSLAQLVVPLLLTARLPKIKVWVPRPGPLLGILFALSLGVGALSTPQGEMLAELIEVRTVTRISEAAEIQGSLAGGLLEDFNIAVFDFLKHEPAHSIFGVGLGNAHIFANSYLPEFARPYADGTPFVAKSSMLRWISELGVVSLLVFLAWLVMLSRNLEVAFTRIGLHRVALQVIGRFVLPVTLIWLASGYVSPQFYMTIGTVLGLTMALPRASRSTQAWEST